MANGCDALVAMKVNVPFHHVETTDRTESTAQPGTFQIG
jgi:hypothetical protein